jgi:phosphatidylinositol alpha-1,6-mannosyltransferase
MKILIYTYEYPPFPGGAGVYSRDLAEGLERLGHDVHVASLYEESSNEVGRAKIHRMEPYQQDPPWSFYFLLKLWLRYRFDVLVVSEYLAQRNLARMVRPWFPYVVVVHGTELLEYFGGNPVSRGATSEQMRDLYRNAAACITGSHATAKLARSLLGNDGSRFIPIHYGINLERFPIPDMEQVRTLRARYGEHSEIVLCVGRLALDKGHEVLLQAFHRVHQARPDTHLVIVGEGPLRKKLLEQCESLGLVECVHFPGKVPPEELSAWYAACDVFALPSKSESRWEGFGLVFLEANLFEKPVVGGNEGGVPEAIADGETGLVVNPRDPDAVARAILRLLQDKSVAREMGKKGRERVWAYYTNRRMAEETLQTLEKTIPPINLSAWFQRKRNMAFWLLNYARYVTASWRNS